MISKILWFLRCTWYYDYRWQKLAGDVASDFGASVSIGLFLDANLLSLNLILKYYANIPLLFFKFGNLVGAISVVSVALLTHFFLASGGRFKLIIKEFENEPRNKKSWHIIMTIAYMIFSFIVCGYLLAVVKI